MPCAGIRATTKDKHRQISRVKALWPNQQVLLSSQSSKHMRRRLFCRPFFCSSCLSPFSPSSFSYVSPMSMIQIQKMKPWSIRCPKTCGKGWSCTTVLRVTKVILLTHLSTGSLLEVCVTGMEATFHIGYQDLAILSAFACSDFHMLWLQCLSRNANTSWFCKESEFALRRNSC